MRARVALHENIEVVPGLPQHHPRAEHGRGVRPAQRRGFPVQVAWWSRCWRWARWWRSAFYATTFGSETRLARLSLTLILAGACGNLIDRAVAGAVVDFVDVYFGTWHFWTFNVADSAITIGAILLILDMFRTGKHVPSPA